MPNSAGANLPNGRSYEITDQTVTDKVTGLVWQRQVPAQGYAWAAAKDACENLVLAGQNDWRLPSRIELVSLIESGRTEPAIDLGAFPFVSGNRPLSDWYWTSTPFARDPNRSWYVYFYFGYPDTDLQTSDFPARCVRAGLRGGPAQHYEIAADTVRDTGTGLVWQRGVSTGMLDFQASTDYCANLTLGGSDAWRLPSLLELATLVDDTRADPSIDTVAFPDTTGETFWSSTMFAGSATRAWYLRFDEGSALYEPLTVLRRARCLR